MPEQPNDIGFKLGELTGQMHSLIATINHMNEALSKMDQRLQKNEKVTTELTVKMAILGIGSGGVGSLAMTFLMQYIK